MTKASAAGITVDLLYPNHVDTSSLETEVVTARATLENGTGPGAEMRGWLDLPTTVGDGLIEKIEKTAETANLNDAFVVVGIGGSYLGARAVIDALVQPFDTKNIILYAGHHLDGAYLNGLLNHLKSRSYCVNVISKSGGTTEPDVALRILWQDLSSRFSPEEMRQRVIATTDGQSGLLRTLAEKNNLPLFEIPHDVGGRFSVLSSVGLLPIAVAGLDIRALLRGAGKMSDALREPSNNELKNNPAMLYAAYRLACYRDGKKTEVLSTCSPSLTMTAEWWKQLFGESEGKNGSGIFPASMNLTTDLHSLGQWMQDGERTVFETAIDIIEGSSLEVPKFQGESDEPDLLAGKKVHEINRIALDATLHAHGNGGVPCAKISIESITEETIGALLYFFEYTCAVSAYALGVNPFDQPGVEAYKKQMKNILRAKY